MIQCKYEKEGILMIDLETEISVSIEEVLIFLKEKREEYKVTIIVNNDIGNIVIIMKNKITNKSSKFEMEDMECLNRSFISSFLIGIKENCKSSFLTLR